MEIIPVCPLDAQHDIFRAMDDDLSYCWACDAVNTLYYIAIRVTDDPAWAAREVLDHLGWKPLT